MPKRRHASSVALIAAFALALAPSAAHAGATWSSPVAVDTNALLSVSCASESFCVAVDSAGRALVFNGATWQAPADIDGVVPLSSVSCPSDSFCAAVDMAGNAVTFNGIVWSAPTDIDGASSLSSVSCSSAAFCVAVDSTGKALTFNGIGWSAPQDIDGANSLSSVSCASPAFCIAVDRGGSAVTYTGAWGVPGAIDSPRRLSSVSCPSVSFCMAIDLDAYFVIYERGTWSPATPGVIGNLSSVSCPSALFCTEVNNGNGYVRTYDGAVWASRIPVIDTNGGLRSVSCVSVTFCATVDDGGNALIYSAPPPSPVSTSPPSISGTPVQGAFLSETHGSWTNYPTGFSYQWERCDSVGAMCSAIPDATSQSYLISSSDVGHTIRVQETASNASGSGLAVSAPTAVVVLPVGIAVSRALVPRGKGAHIRALLRHRGYTLMFEAPSAGRLGIAWYLGHGKALLIAKLSVAVQGPGATEVEIRLTSHGRRLLAHARRLTVIAKGTFAPSGQPATVATKRFTLTR